MIPNKDLKIFLKSTISSQELNCTPIQKYKKRFLPQKTTKKL